MGRGLLALLLLVAAARLAGDPQAGQLARIETRSEKVLLAKSGSHHLAKGKLIVLDKGQAEEWQVLAQEGQEPKRLKRLHKGRPMSVMLGKSESEDAVHFPAVTYAWKTLRLEATGYDPGPEANGQGNQGTTYSGTRARFGIVAVDPKVIPLKSLLYVEGYGPAKALDIGGAIKGSRIDLCFNSTREAEAWGRKKTRVFLLSGLPKAEADKVLDALKN